MPDGAVVVDPVSAYRWTCVYTPERLDQIKARRSLAEVTQLCDIMLEDDRLRAVAFLRAQALVGEDLEFVEGSGRRRKKALRAAEGEADLWDMLPEAEWLQMHVWGLLMNFGTGRKRWWERKGRSDKYVPRSRNGRIVPQLEFWHPRNFRLDAAGSQWIARVEVPGSNLPVDRDIDFSSGEFVCFCPWGGSGDISRGLWLPAAKLWLLKQYVIRDSATLSGRLSTPIKVIEYQLVQQGSYVGVEGGADDKRKELVQEILAMGKRGVISLPPGFTMKLLGVPATSWQMLKEQLAYCDTAFGILWTGNNLVAETKGGSLAAAKEGNETFLTIKRFDAQAESTFVHNDVLTDWALVNFGDAEAAPWPSRDVEPEEDKKSAAETMSTVMQAVKTGEAIGWLFDKEAVGERFELDLVEGQPNTLAPIPSTNTPPVDSEDPNAQA